MRRGVSTLLTSLLFSGAAARYERLLDEQAIDVPCAETPDTAELTILTTLPFVPSRVENASSHVYESLLAIGENARTTHVREIVVVLDAFASKDPKGKDVSAALRRNVRETQKKWAAKIEAPASSAELSKIRAYVFGRQPTYSDLFRFADATMAGRLVALLNADIVLRNVEALDASAFAQKPPLALVLGVVGPNDRYKSVACERPPIDRCDTRLRHSGYSWDVEIFKAPLVHPCFALLDDAEGPIYMNSMGAENRVGHFLATSGYQIFNPCRSIVAEHWHCEPKMHQLDELNRRVKADTLGNGSYIPVQAVTRGIRCTDATRFHGTQDAYYYHHHHHHARRALLMDTAAPRSGRTLRSECDAAVKKIRKRAMRGEIRIEGRGTVAAASLTSPSPQILVADAVAARTALRHTAALAITSS